MKLIIVESPSKAKSIQKYVGDNYIVLSSIGHINQLASGGKFGIGVELNNQFKTHYILMKDKISVLDEMINAASKSEMILLATDDDREGEAIANHIKNYLISTGKPIKRIKFQEITKDAILKAIEQPQELDQNLIKAQEARRVLDRIVGFMVSPFLINFYGPNLSAGRVQSVAVKMIVDRENEISNFKPEEFWNIFANVNTINNESFFVKFQGRPTNKNDANAIVNLIKNEKEFYVATALSAQKKEKPCAPMTTASLQQYMAKKFSFEPDRTMKAAQTLYENGYCTYIRTDSTRISDEAIGPVREWIKTNGLDIPKKPNVYVAKTSAQDAHECIRPTNVNTIADDSLLTGDERDVYKVIWQHFIASQMNPAIWDTLRITIRARTNPKLIFTTSGKALAYKGFLEIFGDIDTSKIDMPMLHKNDILILANKDAIKTEQRFTQPPPRYNVASILKELELKEIGRPATYAEITKKIAARNYVEKTNNTYKPTDLGIKITNILTGLFPFMKYEYSADLEKKLDEIAAGNMNYLNMLKDFFIPFKDQLDQAYIKNGGSICDKCGNPMSTRTNHKEQIKFLACSAFPRCRNTKPIENELYNARKSEPLIYNV